MTIAPLVFIWACFKILSNRRLMGRMMIASVVLFVIGISVGMLFEPAEIKAATAARIAAEKS